MTCAVRQAVEGTRFLPPSGTLVSVLVGYSGQPQASQSVTRGEMRRTARAPARLLCLPGGVPGGPGRLGAPGGAAAPLAIQPLPPVPEPAASSAADSAAR